jgi:hypothetical protein
MNRENLLKTPLSNDVIGIITNYLDYSLDKMEINVRKNFKSKYKFKNPNITLLDIIVMTTKKGFGGVFMGEDIYEQLNMNKMFNDEKIDGILFHKEGKFYYLIIEKLNNKNYVAIAITNLNIIENY